MNRFSLLIACWVVMLAFSQPLGAKVSFSMPQGEWFEEVLNQTRKDTFRQPMPTKSKSQAPITRIPDFLEKIEIDPIITGANQ